MRELENVIERAVILSDGLEIGPQHLRLTSDGGSVPTLGDVIDLGGSLAEVVRRASALAEEEAIAAALRHADGDRAAAALRLGISPSTLARRLRSIDAPRES